MPPKSTKGKTQPTSAPKKISRVSKLIEKRPRVFGIGGAVLPKRDLSRVAKYPKYVRVQRQRKVLYERLKVPPAINQFSRTLDKNAATTLFKLLHNHRPETPQEKKERLLNKAAAQEGKTTEQEESKKPNVIKFGLKHVTALVEQKKAKLVVIAHDVNPIELVIWLPTLCKKKGIPFVIVKSKSRLGQVIGQKTAAALAFVNVHAKDKKDFDNLVSIAKDQYLETYTTVMKTSGGQKFSRKHNQAIAKRARLTRRAKA